MSSFHYRIFVALIQSTVALLVEHGANVSLRAGASKSNFTALVFAAQQGHVNVVKKLVELGADPDVRGGILFVNEEFHKASSPFA